MLNKRGFTLVELLVVVAIITILAATVVPRVQNWISKARMSRAMSEIKSADLALTKMLVDADRKNFSQFFDPNGTGHRSLFQAAAALSSNAAAVYKMYNDVFYELLRRGRDADLSDYGLYVYDSVKKKLGQTYMDIAKDPWAEHTYQFLPGPLSFFSAPNPQYTGQLQAAAGIYGLRCYKDDGYVYNSAARAQANSSMRGNPKWDDGNGMPAPFDLPVYIWSYGENLTTDQWIGDTMPDPALPHTGGDDINNWDSGAGWTGFYAQ